MFPHVEVVDNIFIVNLDDLTPQARKYLKDMIIPTLPPSLIHTSVQFLPHLLLDAIPPLSAKI